MSGRAPWIDYYLDARRAQGAFVAQCVIIGVRSIRSATCALFRQLIIWHRRRAALSELHEIDSRTLIDVGLHRGEIWFIADAYARRVPYRPDDRRRRPEVRKGKEE
jgi:uncharacterized protein YjiS (DUF1127 family)